MATVHVYKKEPILTRDMFHNAKTTVSKYEKPVATKVPILNKVSGSTFDNAKKISNLMPTGNQNQSGKVVKKGTHVAKRLNEYLERQKMEAEIRKKQAERTTLLNRGKHVFNNPKM